MTAHEKSRKLLTIALGAGLLVLSLGLLALNAFNWQFLNPETTSEIVVFTALSAIAFLLFVGVLLLLVRNVLKLYAEQNSRVLGSRLRTRMLWGALLVSLVPIVFMFSFSYLLLNRAVDRWFSQPITEMRDDSARIALELAHYSAANARAEAQSIASAVAALTPSKRVTAELDRTFATHEITLQGGFAVAFRGPGGVVVARSRSPEAEPPVRFDPGASGALRPLAQRADGEPYLVNGREFILGDATVAGDHGEPLEIVVGLPLPAGISATTARLRAAADAYSKLSRARRSVRNTYMTLLLMMTSLALFASSWLALHLSKQVTRPVEALADSMALIAAGHYTQRVAESSNDELGELVRSFNHMASDLESSHAQIEASNALLSAANRALEARRGELETMLETIPNGVATVDPEGRIVLANRALSEMLDPGGQQPFIGRRVRELVPPDLLEAFDRLMRRSHRMGSASGEMEVTLGQNGTARALNLLATVALLEGTGERSTGVREHLGYVLVVENATELLQAQKQSAWREVARRVAHEIKNPLTPISLSAEQIARHIERLASALEPHGDDPVPPSIGVIRRSSQVISASVESMRSLVDQFAALAQFPTAHPRPADLNEIVESSLQLFAGRTTGISVQRRFAGDLPLVLADPEAMKRALSNLIDNAVEAMGTSLLRELRLETCVLENGMIELVVADTGTGLTDEMRERLFLPYFSTKQRGTGLGLAIAAKIIQEHGGTIRAEKNEPAGARFLVELRPASFGDGDPAGSAAPELAAVEARG